MLLLVQLLYWQHLETREGVTDKRGCIYSHFRRVEIYIVDSAAGKVSPARGEPLFDGLEGYVKVDDCVHTVGVIQNLGLGDCTREAWEGDGWTEERTIAFKSIRNKCKRSMNCLILWSYCCQKLVILPSSSQLLCLSALRSLRMRRDMTSSGTSWPWSIQDFINRPSSDRHRKTETEDAVHTHYVSFFPKVIVESWLYKCYLNHNIKD